ncbi:MAG: hypothetical protein AB1420_12225 [Bacillota bacterium]
MSLYKSMQKLAVEYYRRNGSTMLLSIICVDSMNNYHNFVNELQNQPGILRVYIYAGGEILKVWYLDEVIKPEEIIYRLMIQGYKLRFISSGYGKAVKSNKGG